MKIRPWGFLRRLYPDMIWEIDDSNGLFLTFDDGPTPGVTEWVLATLKRYDAKATFFVLGKNVELYPDLYQLILDRGHKIGNHTYSHQKGWELSLERYIEDVDLAGDMLHTELFRPPYARVTRKQLKVIAQRYRIVMWNVLSRDYNTTLTPQICLKETLYGLRGGDIISLHDSAKSFKNTSVVLPAILQKAEELGLKCKILEL